MANNLKNLVFGGGPPPKPSKAGQLVFGDNSKPKPSRAGQLVFGTRPKAERKGVSALVFGGGREPKRKGLSALVFGASGRRRPSLLHVKYRDLAEQKTEFARDPKILKRLLSDTYIRKHLPKEIRGRNGAVISREELRDKIIELAHAQPRGFLGDKPGLRADKLKKLLREDKAIGLYLDAATAERVVTATGYQWYESPDDGPTEEEKSQRIAVSKASSDIIAKQESIKARTLTRLKQNRGRAQDISAVFRGNAAASAAPKGEAAASIGQKGDQAPAASAAAGAGKRAEEESAAPPADASEAGGSQPVFIARGSGVGRVEAAPRPPANERDPANDYFFAPGQVVSPHTGRSLDFKKLIQEKTEYDKDKDESGNSGP